MNKLKNFSPRRISRSCESHRKNSTSNIDILCFSRSVIFDKRIFTTSIFFILEGFAEVTCGIHSKLIVGKNFFFMIPPEAKYSIRFPEKSTMICFQPGEELLVEYISKISYEYYKTKCCRYKSRDVFSLGIEKHIDRILADFVEVRSKGFSSERYVCCKCEELLILMTKYYPTEELIWFFHAVFEKKMVFKSIVLLNRNRLFSVEEFAAATHLNRESFRQHFKETFGETPAKWIQRERADSVYKALVETNKSVLDIIREYGFSNSPNFVRFCHMYLKKTPAAIRSEKSKQEKSKSNE